MVWLQLYDFKIIIILCKWLNNSIWPIDEILTGTTNPNQSGPGSYVNEGTVNIPQSFKTEINVVSCHIQDTHQVGKWNFNSLQT